MSDATLRAAERTAAGEGTAEARARLLAERVRHGITTAEHLSVAAWLGDESARLCGPAWVPPSTEEIRERIHGTVIGRGSFAQFAVLWGPIEHVVVVRVAALCALRVIGRRRAHRAARRVAQATLAWAECPSDERLAAVREAQTMAPEVESSREPAAWSGAHAAYEAAAAVKIPKDPWGHLPWVAACRALLYAVEQAGGEASVTSRMRDEQEAQRLLLLAALCGDPLPRTPGDL